MADIIKEAFNIEVNHMVQMLYLYQLMHCAIAVSAERFGRNPLEFSLNFASHIGSMTCKIHCCTIRSTIVGIPRGLVFPLGFGISLALRVVDDNY